MQYESYPKAKDTPSRKTRKYQRNKVFQHNKKLSSSRAKRGEQ